MALPEPMVTYNGRGSIVVFSCMKFAVVFCTIYFVSLIWWRSFVLYPSFVITFSFERNLLSNSFYLLNTLY